MRKSEIRAFIWSLLTFALWAVGIFGGYFDLKGRFLVTFLYALWVGLDSKIDVLLEILEEKEEENDWRKKLP